MNIKHDFTMELTADNNFSVLNRIINILNRRRVRIKKLVAHEDSDNFRKGGVTMLLHTSNDMAEKVKVQLEKLIEVEEVTYHEGNLLTADLTESVMAMN